MASGSNPNLKVEEKYTKAEIEAMADKCFKHCDHCFRYEPIYDFMSSIKTPKTSSKDEKLFRFCTSGCYYAHEFPWTDIQFGETQWCIFFGLKDEKNKEVERIYDILCALTKDNLKTNTK